MKELVDCRNETKVLELNNFESFSVEVTDGSNLTLKILNLNENKDAKFYAKVGSNSKLTVIFADFSNGNINLNSVVDLVEEGAECEWHLATLANQNYKKNFDISFNHLVGHTTAVMDNYGVSRDHSTVVFTGENRIRNGAKKSVTSQTAKIITFDEKSNGIASPRLCIDENDVVASHAAVVGQLNSDHMFYLMSRGLSKEEARELITLGYIQPISRYFSDENKQKIEIAIKEAM